MPELIHALVRRLRDERGWSTSTLAAHTVITGKDMGITAKAIERLEANPGTLPKASTIEALARAFKVDESEFYEWPIALAARDARATPEAERRRAVDAARKADRRRRDTQSTGHAGRGATGGKGQAA